MPLDRFNSLDEKGVDPTVENFQGYLDEFNASPEKAQMLYKLRWELQLSKNRTYAYGELL